jgi:hypothetical protein
METLNAVDQICKQLSGIDDLYNRLVLLVGHPDCGKSAILRSLAEAEHVPVLNVGAELSRKLLDLTDRQRVLQLPRMLEEAAGKLPAHLSLLDNTELLFDPVLRQDPLRLLQGLSRGRTIVATWLGDFDGGVLTYAAPEHPEFRRYPAADILLVCVNQCDEHPKAQR